eukprot:4260052-Ditylum_brightwellii.AAC.1
MGKTVFNAIILVVQHFSTVLAVGYVTDVGKEVTNTKLEPMTFGIGLLDLPTEPSSPHIEEEKIWYSTPNSRCTL